jgi:hypothetical protein
MSSRPASRSWADDDEDDFDLEAWKSTADTSAPSATSLPPLQLPTTEVEPSFTMTVPAPAPTPGLAPTFKPESSATALAAFHQAQDIEAAKITLLNRALADWPDAPAYPEMNNYGADRRSGYSANWKRAKVAGGWDCRGVVMFRASGLRHMQVCQTEEKETVPVTTIALETGVKHQEAKEDEAEVALLQDIARDVSDGSDVPEDEPLMWDIELDEDSFTVEKYEMPLSDEDDIADDTASPRALRPLSLAEELMTALAREDEDAELSEDDTSTPPSSPPSPLPQELQLGMPFFDDDDFAHHTTTSPTIRQRSLAEELEAALALEEDISQDLDEDTTTPPSSPLPVTTIELETPLHLHEDLLQDIPEFTTTTATLLISPPPTPSLAITIPGKSLVSATDEGYYSDTSSPISPPISPILSATREVLNAPICVTQLGMSAAGEFAWKRGRRGSMVALRRVAQATKQTKKEDTAELTAKIGCKSYLREKLEMGWSVLARMPWGKAVVEVAAHVARH